MRQQFFSLVTENSVELIANLFLKVSSKQVGSSRFQSTDEKYCFPVTMTGSNVYKTGLEEPIGFEKRPHDIG